MIDLNGSALFYELWARLTLPNILLIILSYFVFCSISQVVYYHYYHPLACFPGPWLAACTRLWLTSFDFRSADLRSRMLRLHDKYGAYLQALDTNIALL